MAVNAAAAFAPAEAQALVRLWDDVDQEWPSAKAALRAELE